MAGPAASITYSSLRPTSAIPCDFLYKFGPSGTARPLQKLRMQMASARLLTFQNWNPGPDGAPSPTDLAMAGFVYRGVEDHVQCSTCCTIITDWCAEHNPLEEHRRHNPECIFLLEPVPRLPSTIPSQRATFPAIVRKIATSTDVSLCKICYVNEMCSLFRPCGHLLTCQTCALKMTSCPVCRKPISETIRAFISFE